MGPQLLIDKSTLQSLSQEETDFLNKHYWVVYSPILFIEILGDLKKFGNDIEKSKSEIAKTASKITGGESSFTANYQFLLHANLLGYEVIMDHRPVLLGGQEITSKNGEKGIFFDEEPEHIALRQWLKGKFSEAEQVLSDLWRKSTRSIDLKALQKIYDKKLPIVKTYQELVVFSEELANTSNMQFENLRFLLYEAGFSEIIRNNIFGKWINEGMPVLKTFAPYAYYCLRVFISFYFGVASGLIGTKPTNRIDLEYVLYLPFCKAFASTDKFLRDFAPLFLDERQDFIWGDDLKKDLKRIQQHWVSLTEEEKGEYRRKHGDYPPDFEGSVTNQLWKKHLMPREKYDGVPEITPEREKEIMEKLAPMIDAIDAIRKPKE